MFLGVASHPRNLMRAFRHSAAAATAVCPRFCAAALPGGVRPASPRLACAPTAAPQAKLAEEAERYEDMVTNVKALAELNVQVRPPARTSSPHSFRASSPLVRRGRAPTARPRRAAPPRS